MEIEHLTTANKTIGAKQTAKAIARGEVEMVFVANNSDDALYCRLLSFVNNKACLSTRSIPWRNLARLAKLK